jgi:hypothetical protein
MTNDVIVIVAMILMWINGYIFSWLIFGEDTPFKRGFIDGITLRFLWRKFK